MIAFPVGDVHRRVNDFLGNREAVVFDAPQLEDHAHIARSIMRYASEWIVPLTPAPIELDRMAPIGGEMSDVQSLRAQPARAAVLLNRTNRPDATRTGPDADAREALTERGFDVLSTPHSPPRPVRPVVRQPRSRSRAGVHGPRRRTHQTSGQSVNQRKDTYRAALQREPDGAHPAPPRSLTCTPDTCG